MDLSRNQDLASPRDFDRETAGVAPEELRDTLRVSSDLDRHRDWLRADLALGFDAIYLHHVGPDPARFIATFGREVLPGLSG